jgi:hypothetical protein
MLRAALVLGTTSTLLTVVSPVRIARPLASPA